MFAKSVILFVACLSMVIAAPEPKAEPKPDPLLVSTYGAGLPLVNTYSTAGLPLVSTYSAAHHHYPVHARTVAINSPLVRTVAADIPVAYSGVNPLHYTAISSPFGGAVVV